MCKYVGYDALKIIINFVWTFSLKIVQTYINCGWKMTNVWLLFQALTLCRYLM